MPFYVRYMDPETGFIERSATYERREDAERELARLVETGVTLAYIVSYGEEAWL